MEVNNQPKQVINFDQSQQKLIDLYLSKDIPKVVLTLAAPGTGKTTTISKIIDSITLKEKFKNIMVLTFTRKTRFDLIRKIANISENPQKLKPKNKNIRNIHSFAYEMLGYQKVLEQNYLKQFLRAQLRKMPQLKNTDDFQKQFIKQLEYMMAFGYNQLQWQHKCHTFEQIPRLKQLGYLLNKYRENLQSQYNNNKAISYDYSLIKTLQYVEKGYKTQDCNLDQLQFIIVDEFQDSNPVQLKIIHALMKRSSKDTKLLLVGDFDQNIYTWRHAHISYIDQFVNNFKMNGQLSITMLQNSYRLTQSLTNLSQKLINSYDPYKFFRKRYYKDYVLYAKNTQNKDPQVRKFESQFSEVRWVVDKIYELKAMNVPLGQMAILLRSFKGTFFSKFAFELKRRVNLGQQPIFYDSKYNKDLFKSQTIKYLMNIFSYCLKRRQGKDTIINEMKQLCAPIALIGQEDEVKHRMLKGKRFHEGLLQNGYDSNVKNKIKKQQNWKKFIQDIKKIESLVNKKKGVTMIDVVKEIVSILKSSTWGSVEADQDKLDQLYISIQQIEECISDQILDDNPVYPVFNQLKQLNGKDDDDWKHQPDSKTIKKKRNRLQIQTIHDSKGLQYKAVFICSLNYSYPFFQIKSSYSSSQYIDNKLPIYKINEIESQKQELRIIYVALTRAKVYSYISSSQRDIYLPKIITKIKNREHKQFKFFKENATIYEYVEFQYQLDQTIKDNFQIEILIKQMQQVGI